MDPRAAPADSAEAGAPRPSHRLPRLRRGAGFIAALLCLAALLVVAAGEWAAQNERDAQWDNLRRSGEVQALALRGVATRYNYLPFTTAQHPLVRQLLHHPASQEVRDAANTSVRDADGNKVWAGNLVQDGIGMNIAAGRLGNSDLERKSLSTGLRVKGKLSDQLSLETNLSDFRILKDNTLTNMLPPRRS